MRGASNFDAACVPLRSTPTTTKSAPPRPASRPLRGPVTPTPPDRQAAPVFKRTDGGSHAHSNRTHPGMARGSGSNPSGDRSTRDACPCTPGRRQAGSQAQAALGRVTSDGAALPPRSRHVSHRCSLARKPARSFDDDDYPINHLAPARSALRCARLSRKKRAHDRGCRLKLALAGIPLGREITDRMPSFVVVFHSAAVLSTAASADRYAVPRPTTPASKSSMRPASSSVRSARTAASSPNTAAMMAKVPPTRQAV